MAFEGLKNLKDLLGVTAAYARLDAAMVKELEDHHRRLYAVEENQKMDKASRQALYERVGKLELTVQQMARELEACRRKISALEQAGHPQLTPSQKAANA